MLQRLRLTDFKSFTDEAVELAPVTMLVGANASGKSNFLDAIQFLRALSFDLLLSEVLNGEERSAPDAWRGLRGGAQEAARVETSAFTLESTWLAPHPDDVFGPSELFEGKQLSVAHRITCRTEPGPSVEAESISGAGGRELFKTTAAQGGVLQVPFRPARWGPSSRDSSAAVTELSAERSLLHRMLAKFKPGAPDTPMNVATHIAGLLEAFERIQLLNIKPEEMRGYGRRGGMLGVEGRNLSGVLADLCEEPETKQSLVDERKGKRISARSLSDGTLRFLGILLALRLATPGSTLLMEEVELGLHPTRIRILVEYLEAVARERNIQIIATTHSPVVLQWLSEGALRSTLVFGRVPEHEGTIVRRLGDLPHFDLVAQRTGIEELFTTGWLEMAL